MITVKNSKFEELYKFSTINMQSHVNNFLTIKSLETHQQEFQNESNLFLSIFSASGKLAGYLILVKEKYTNTVQIKRILISENHLGIGQSAISAMENYCITKLKTKKIWLDVFKNNNKAIHIYEKLGYTTFKHSVENSREVVFYEKTLK